MVLALYFYQPISTQWFLQNHVDYLDFPWPFPGTQFRLGRHESPGEFLVNGQNFLVNGEINTWPTDYQASVLVSALPRLLNSSSAAMYFAGCLNSYLNVHILPAVIWKTTSLFSSVTQMIERQLFHTLHKWLKDTAFLYSYTNYSETSPYISDSDFSLQLHKWLRFLPTVTQMTQIFPYSSTSDSDFSLQFHKWFRFLPTVTQVTHISPYSYTSDSDRLSLVTHMTERQFLPTITNDW